MEACNEVLFITLDSPSELFLIQRIMSTSPVASQRSVIGPGGEYFVSPIGLRPENFMLLGCVGTQSVVIKENLC